jgi:isopenicillin N synthase-like dioxygenase
MKIPVIDLSQDEKTTAAQIGRACSEHGFFCITKHGVSLQLQQRLEDLSQTFFALDETTKMQIAMSKGGKAWRGFFPVGGELTSGKPDLKEGLYFGSELSPIDPRPLHGANLFPAIPDYRETLLAYMEAMTQLSHRLMRFVSLSLGLAPDYFHQHYTSDPTLLFRVFHYPPSTEENIKTHPWGVGTHTDYGLLTILKQDDCGGLEVHAKSGWIAVPPLADTFVCNIGDMLDYLTQGRYRSTPHRVRNTSGLERYSYPFFFDPGFSAPIRPLPNLSGLPDRMAERWDKTDLYVFQGNYGDYLLKKVSNVFPELTAFLQKSAQ